MTRTDPDEGRDDAEPPEALQIDVANQQSEHPIDARALQRAVAAVLTDSPYRTAEISVAVVDAAAMHQLNRRFLNHDYETDVFEVDGLIR